MLTHFLGFKGVYMSEGIADLVAGIITAIVIFKTFPKIFREREIEVKEKTFLRSLTVPMNSVVLMYWSTMPVAVLPVSSRR